MTEVQSQAVKPNAIAFEVWFKPIVENARLPKFSPMRGDKNVSKEYLIKKLEEAELRKKKLTLHSLSKLAAKEKYIQKLRADADQQGKLAEEKLKMKMETYGENKHAIDKALHSRLNAKEERIKGVKAKNQALVDAQCKDIEERIQMKISQSEGKTEALRQALKNKLQAHGQKLKEAKSVVEEMVQKHSKVTEEKLQKKMEISTEKRQTYLESLKEKMHGQNMTAEQKKQLHEEECAQIQHLYEEKLQYKMVKYEENRSAILKAKQERLHAHNSLAKELSKKAKERKLSALKG